MSGPKRNPDKLNTIGVVVVGICGAVLVYVSIVALQAFYMNDTSEIQTMADYGGQDTAHQSLRATQMNTIEDCAPGAKPEAGKPQTYRIPIKYAIKLVAEGAKTDPANLVPSQGRSDKATILPIFGRPKMAPKTDAAPPADPAAPAGGDTGTAPAGDGTGTPAGDATPAGGAAPATPAGGAPAATPAGGAPAATPAAPAGAATPAGGAKPAAAPAGGAKPAAPAGGAKPAAAPAGGAKPAGTN